MASDRLSRITAACGFGYLFTLVANVAFTTDGPRPFGSVTDEVARVRSVTTALRWSALLGEVGALFLGGLAVGLALLLLRRGRPAAGAVAAVAGTAAVTLESCSFAALAASAQSADRALGVDAVMGLGNLHTTLLLLVFAPSGVLVLASVAGRMWGRTGTVLSTVVGVSGIVAIGCVLSVREDAGPLALPLVIAFWGVPVWGAVLGYRLLRPRKALRLAPSGTEVDPTIAPELSSRP